MGNISEHFDTSEFLVDGRRSATANPPLELVWRLEALRRRIGRPLPLLSWRRSPAYNRRVGGAGRSWHLHGLAVDVPAGLVTVDQARAVGFRGIGTRRGWVVHLDVRPGPAVTFVDGA